MATLNPTSVSLTRRAFAAAGLFAAIPLALPPGAEAAPTRVISSSVGQALAGWAQAQAKIAAAAGRLAAIDLSRPPMPESLRIRPDDDKVLRDLLPPFVDDEGRMCRPTVLDADKIATLAERKEQGAFPWISLEREPAWVLRARARAEGILADAEGWDAACAAAHEASGIDEAESAFREADLDRRAIVEGVIFAAAHPDTLALKLRVFMDLWAEDHDGDELAGLDLDDFDWESPAAEVAAAIAVDLLTLMRQAAAGDVAAAALRQLAETAVALDATLAA